MHYWEYNSTNVSDGKPVDVHLRKPESRQLTLDKDAEIIANYSTPSYVLGWAPAMAPLFLSQPEAVTIAAAESVTFRVKVTAIPDPTYQWLKNDAPIPGATGESYRIPVSQTGDAARYAVVVANASGSVTSRTATLTVK